MKIIYLHQYFTFPFENGGTRSFDLATFFVKAGYCVTVITATSDLRYKTGKRWIVENYEGLEIHRLYLPYGNYLSYAKRISVFLQFLWFSSLRLLTLKGDVLLATSTPLTIGIPALVKKWLNKTPFIFEVRDVWPEAVIAIGAVKNRLIKQFLYALEKWIYQNAFAIVPLSTDMQRSIISRYPIVGCKTSVVIENISEINRFQNAKETKILEEMIGFKPRFSILYAGTFGKVNGIHNVVILAELTKEIDPKLVYLLIGSGSEKDNIKELAIKKGVLNKNLFIFDPVSKNELPVWYKSVSMGSSFVIDIKELWANSANKFFDTLAAGKPILINHDGWQAEVIRGRNAGYILPANISIEVASSFVDYTYNSELIELQRKNALSLATEKYSLEVAVNKYLGIFSRVNVY
ncbi:MAG: glycosyltransferase family 4 protein [Bacteroidales bacterium]|nr:glycosyltransferase family 4 protein [Bacteroidales bacterium]